MDYIVHIRRRESPYALIDKSALRDGRLSFKARGVLAYALTYEADHELSIGNMAGDTKDGVHAIQQAFLELAEHGYAELKIIRGNHGRVIGRRWFIYENPTEKAKTASSVKL